MAGNPAMPHEDSGGTGTTHRNINRDGVFDVEIPKAIEGYTMLSTAGVPFGVAPGNHDYDAWWSVAGSEIGPNGRAPAHVGGLDNFRIVFGDDSKFFADKEWYVGSFRDGANSAQVFSAGGYQFLHLALEMQPGDEVLTWQNRSLPHTRGYRLLLPRMTT